MAKVIKGGRRASKKDPLKRYGVYKHGGRVIRRAMHPEFYMHSWSRKVKYNRNLFANVMENYRKLDIVTRQAYTEAIYIKPKIPLSPLIRRVIEEMRKRKPPRGPGPGPGLPPNIPNPYAPHNPVAPPNERISPEPWPYPGYEPWPKERGTRGHEPAVGRGIAKGHERHPERNPLPGDIPGPKPTRDNQHNPYQVPIIITVEIDPGDMEGVPYEVYLTVKSEYNTVKRVIRSHKREVIIIVAIGMLVVFTYGLLMGGIELVSGTELLVTPEAEAFYGLLPLNIPGLIIKHITRSYYKRLMLKEMSKLNIHALNLSKGWPCYTIVEDLTDGYNYNFFTGFDENHIGDPAAAVTVKFHWDEGTVSIEPVCFDPPDTVEVYLGMDPLIVCGPVPRKLVPPVLWNYTKKVYGSWREVKGDGWIRYEFEDRPGFGDYDYNDAYFTLYLDPEGRVINWVAEEGDHCDEIGIWWNGIQWAHFPKRC